MPVIVRDLNDREASQFALIENLQRENLNPIEEAAGYQLLIDEYGMTQEEVAKTVGRSRPAVANAIRLLNLPAAIREYLEKGKLTVGHAKALAAVKDEAAMLELAKRAADGRITVRDIEAYAQKQNAEKPQQKPRSQDQIYYEEMEISLENTLGRKVRVQSGKKSHTLVLEFFDRDDLQALCRKLTQDEA